jgi:hypothetical protein
VSQVRILPGAPAETPLNWGFSLREALCPASDSPSGFVCVSGRRVDLPKIVEPDRPEADLLVQLVDVPHGVEEQALAESRRTMIAGR